MICEGILQVGCPRNHLKWFHFFFVYSCFKRVLVLKGKLKTNGIKIGMIIYFQNRQPQRFKVHLTILRFLDQSAS